MAALHGQRDVYGHTRSLSVGSVVGIANTQWAGWHGVRIVVGTRYISV
jgi:hypothetical protein